MLYGKDSALQLTLGDLLRNLVTLYGTSRKVNYRFHKNPNLASVEGIIYLVNIATKKFF
jgi:hypothetical protein